MKPIIKFDNKYDEEEPFFFSFSVGWANFNPYSSALLYSSKSIDNICNAYSSTVQWAVAARFQCSRLPMVFAMP